MKYIFLLLILLCFGCTQASRFVGNNVVKIIFENNSPKNIDTAIIYINDYKFSIHNIDTGKIIIRNISVDSITLNNHDVTIRSYLINKEKTNFKGGFYYTDLGGSLNSTYKITVLRNLNAKIE